MKNKKVLVLIPALNPNREFISFIEALTEKGLEVIVVNDGSTLDRNYIFKEISSFNHVIVLSHNKNMGKGEALKTGLNYYIHNYIESETFGIVTADADGQHSIKDILKIASILREVNSETLILGVRNFNEAGVPKKSIKGNNLTRKIFKKLYGTDITDTQTGLRGLTYNFAKSSINLQGQHFEYEMNMLIYAVKNHINITEQRIKTIYINNNKGSNYKMIRDSLKIAFILIKNKIKK